MQQVIRPQPGTTHQNGWGPKSARNSSVLDVLGNCLSGDHTHKPAQMWKTRLHFPLEVPAKHCAVCLSVWGGGTSSKCHIQQMASARLLNLTLNASDSQGRTSVAGVAGDAKQQRSAPSAGQGSPLMRTILKNDGRLFEKILNDKAIRPFFKTQKSSPAKITAKILPIRQFWTEENLFCTKLWWMIRTRKKPRKI